MVTGIISGRMPLVQITVGYGLAVQEPLAILDTGFTGDLQIPEEIAKELDLEPIGVASVKMADGNDIELATAMAVVSMENETRAVEVIISDGAPLIGMDLLYKFGYKAIVDCKKDEVKLETEQ